MLPIPHDNGSRLAAILPTGYRLLTSGSVRVAVTIVVDGLGWENLRSFPDDAPYLNNAKKQRIETVAPSTTAAALTTITTGKMPGEHGMLGYKVYDADADRLRSPIKDWHGISNVRDFQPCATVFETSDIDSYVFARKAHMKGGMTDANLRGATYLPNDTIRERFIAAKEYAQTATAPTHLYIYVDELDKAGHHNGAGSAEWLKWLRTLDTAFGDFLIGLKNDVGVALTADHGMINIAPEKKLMLGDNLLDGVRFTGGEPRFVYLYLDDADTATQIKEHYTAKLGKTAWIGTRHEFIKAGWFGTVAEKKKSRIGDVIVAAKSQVVFHTPYDKPDYLKLIGHHGSLSDTERGIPLITAGAYTRTGFKLTER